MPPIPGLDGLRHITCQRVFELDRLPDRLTVLGGGPVGVELAQAFQRLGSQVTLLERAQGPLPGADPDAATILERRLRSEGIRTLTGVTPTVADLQDAELVLIATGRVPNIRSLDLARAGIRFGASAIVVDHHLRTSQKHIYAAGDVTGSHQFTHYAGWQGFVAARDALLPGSERGVAEKVPWAVFTDPEIAQVGLTESDARVRALRFEAIRIPLERVDRAQTVGETEGLIKVIVTGSGRLLGATVVAPGAAEVVNELSVAVAAKVDLSKLARTIHIYPTIGLAIQQLASEFALRRSTRGALGAVVRLLAGSRHAG